MTETQRRHTDPESFLTPELLERLEHVGRGTYTGADRRQSECLGADDTTDVCAGPVELRTPMSGTGISYPRCERHFELRLDLQDRLSRDYPDSSQPPAWFDPSNAGERWDDDY